MTRRPKPLLPTTTALSNKHETEIRSNILVSLVFAVGLASGASGFVVMLSGNGLVKPVPLAATQNFLIMCMQYLPLEIALLYYQYLRHARECVQKALAADPLAQDDTWKKA